MRRRSRILSFGFCGLLVLAGVAGGVAVGGGTGQVLALVLVSMGLVFATALVFFEVGLSEDRERAREQARASRPSLTPHATTRFGGSRRWGGHRRRPR